MTQGKGGLTTETPRHREERDRESLRRFFCSSLFCVSVSLWFTLPSKADVEVAPPPREVRADGSRDPAPAAEPAARENPIEVVERIIKNSQAVGDKLAQTDTGTDTRTTQGKILKDIDSLLNRQDDPPPQGGGGAGDQKNQKDKNNDQKKDGKSGDQKKDGMPPQGDKEPKGGNDQQASGRKPRMGEKSGEPKGPGGGKPEPGMAKAEPMPGKSPANPTASKDPMGGATAGNPMGKAAIKPALPIDDDVVKEVWGHLPDKLRQQVTQYYREQFMPKYSELLKQYYSSLANTPQKPGEMEK